VSERENPFEALAQAWEALTVANEALVAVNFTGSQELSRGAMRLLARRVQAFAVALETVLEETER